MTSTCFSEILNKDSESEMFHSSLLNGNVSDFFCKKEYVNSKIVNKVMSHEYGAREICGKIKEVNALSDFINGGR